MCYFLSRENRFFQAARLGNPTRKRGTTEFPRSRVGLPILALIFTHNSRRSDSIDPRMKDECLDHIGGNSLKPILLITATLLTLIACGSHGLADEVARQARHLLAQKCFVCHGPDRNSETAKETDLRLDRREVAIEYDALVPGDAGLVDC